MKSKFNIKTVIPSCKSINECAAQIYMLESKMSFVDMEIIFTGLNASAAINRNEGLKRCNKGDLVIMIDDDICTVPYFWDLAMTGPFELREDISIVSARIMSVDGSYQPVMGSLGVKRSGWVEVPRCPTAMISFIHDGELFFDEDYIGSGWEDTQFCRDIKQKYPDKKIIINNDIKVTHINECKNQLGENFYINKATYIRKNGSED